MSDNIINGQFCGAEINLVQTVKNIKNIDASLTEVLIIAMTDEDEIKVIKTCDDGLAGELLVDALYLVEPDIFVDVD